jgi:rRNA-processing protein FCF1
VDCVLSLIGEKNPEHFFVATQDSDLRAKLREVWKFTTLSCSCQHAVSE